MSVSKTHEEGVDPDLKGEGAPDVHPRPRRGLSDRGEHRQAAIIGEWLQTEAQYPA